MTGFRKTLLAGAGAVALIAGGAGAASAQGYYLKGLGGASWIQGDKLKVTGAFDDPSVKMSYNTGYILGAAIGYNYSPNVSVEFEYTYRNADIKNGKVDGDTAITGGSAKSNALMVNAYYNFDGMGANRAWRPYLGAGLGAVAVKYDTKIDGDTLNWKNDGMLGYQVMGGVAYDVSPNWVLTGELRYMGTENKKLSGPGGASAKPNYSTLDFLVGAAYRF